jgi:hypothetical protein
MPYKLKFDRNRWNRERLLKMTDEEREIERAKRRVYAKRCYWKNPEPRREKSKKLSAIGYAKQKAKERADRLADGYIIRCLKQRGWDAPSIQNAREHKQMWELIREHIKARRELRQ